MIETVVGETECAFRESALWSAHPIDLEDGPLQAVASLYLGAAGVIWALHHLERSGVAGLHHDWAPVAAQLAERYLARPDYPELVEGAVPSLLMGETGILLVAHTLAPAPWQEERLLNAVLANAAHPSRELMWGSPGTMVAAHVMASRTGEKRWRQAWTESADLLWSAWDDELWLQKLYGSSVRYLGAGHGFAGTVLALAQGDLLDATRRSRLEERAVVAVARYAERAGGLCQWPPSPDSPLRPQPIRTQWCHGAPGIVASLALLAPDDELLTELLLAGGELTWQAGPLVKGSGLCHGTAGIGYALLKLFERTGDELWLVRARAFAMHAIQQVERATAQFGRGRHTLWTGDPGVALYVQSCLSANADFPTLDHF